MTIQMKATEQYFPAGCSSLIMLYKVVQNFESVDVILRCEHSNEGYYWSRTFQFGFACLSLAGEHLTSN